MSQITDEPMLIVVDVATGLIRSASDGSVVGKLTFNTADPYLSTLPVGAETGEPVAWRWQTNYTDDKWHYAEEVSFSSRDIELGIVKNITPLSPVSAGVDDTPTKAEFLSDLAGVDDPEYFTKKAADTSWRGLAETAMSALKATRAPIPSDEPVAWQYGDDWDMPVGVDIAYWSPSKIAEQRARWKCVRPLFAAPPRSDKANGDWVMVPREPTEAMLDALHDAIDHNIQTGYAPGANPEYAEVSVLEASSLPDAYRAMLSAAPAWEPALATRSTAEHMAAAIRQIETGSAYLPGLPAQVSVPVTALREAIAALVRWEAAYVEVRASLVSQEAGE